MKVVPKAMYHLIAESIAMNKQSVTRHDKQVFPDSEFIYNLIPDPDQVLDRYDIHSAVVCYTWSQLIHSIRDDGRSDRDTYHVYFSV